MKEELSSTPLSGRYNPYNPDLTRPGRISVSPDKILPGLLGTKGVTDPPAILQDCPLSNQNLRERPNNNPATSPPSTHPHKAAHQGSGLGVPDLHEVVQRRAGDATTVWGESHHVHPVRVTRQRANLPPTHHHLGPVPTQNRRCTTAANTLITSPHSTQSHKAAHQGSGRDVPDLHEVVARPADDAIAVRGEIH